MRSDVPAQTATEAQPGTFFDRLGLPRPLIWGFVGLSLFMIGDGVETNILAPYLTDASATTAMVNFATVTSTPAPVVTWGPAGGDSAPPPGSMTHIIISSGSPAASVRASTPQ